MSINLLSWKRLQDNAAGAAGDQSWWSITDLVSCGIRLFIRPRRSLAWMQPSFEEALVSFKRDIAQLATDVDRPLCRAHRVLLTGRLKSVQPVSTTQELSSYVPQNWQQELLNELRTFDQLPGLRSCRQALRHEQKRKTAARTRRILRQDPTEDTPRTVAINQLELDVVQDVVSRLEDRLTLTHAGRIKAAIDMQLR